MRILHTSDWHLGHLLHGHPREREHQTFLKWLSDQLETYRVDVLLIAGDVFDSSNPSARVLAAWYGFLADTWRRCPRLQVLVIGGNHDSAARLEAPNPIFDVMNIKVIGGVPRKQGMVMDCESMTVPLKDAAGQTRAWCAAMPFIRVSDLPPTASIREQNHDRLKDGVRAMYNELLGHVRSRADDDQAIIATGHCFMTGGYVSYLSERKILGGNQHPLPDDMFDDGPAYVALGHLHKPQRVAGRDTIRYCGSPIPLSMEEGRNKNQVLLVTLEGAKAVSVEPLFVPRTVDMIRLSAAPPEEIMAQIMAMDDLRAEMEEEQRPFLEVTVLLEKPVPDLRRRIELAARGKLPRLVRITSQYTGSGRVLGDNHKSTRSLGDVKAEDVFADCYRRHYENEPDADLLAMFHELLESVQEADA